MTFLYRASVVAAALLCLWTATVALALPADEPILYPEVELEENLLDPVSNTPAPAAVTSAPGAPEMDERLIDEDEVVTPEDGDTVIVQPSIGGSGGGNKLVIQSASAIEFATPMSEGVVDFTNPAESTVTVQYLLQITVDELLKKTGRTGYTDEAYAALSAAEGFDPQAAYVVLAQTKGIPPGKRVHAITLGALPDGSTLSVGAYQASLIVTAYDVATSQRSRGSAFTRKRQSA